MDVPYFHTERHRSVDPAICPVLFTGLTCRLHVTNMNDGVPSGLMKHG